MPMPKRLPADLKGLRLAVLALTSVEKQLLRLSLTDQLRICNADTNQDLFGDARWRIGQLVTYLVEDRPSLAVLLGGGAHDVLVWPVRSERFNQLSLKWEDLLALNDSPRIPCERLPGGDVIVTERGRAKADQYADHREDTDSFPVHPAKRMAS